MFGFFSRERFSKTKYQYKPNFTVGVDVLNAGLSAFSDRKLFQGYVSSEIKKNLHAVVDVGFEKIFIRKTVMMLLQTDFRKIRRILYAFYGYRKS